MFIVIKVSKVYPETTFKKLNSILKFLKIFFEEQIILLLFGLFIHFIFLRITFDLVWQVYQLCFCQDILRILVYVFCFVLFCFCFLGPHWWHMEVPRLGVQSELSIVASLRHSHSNTGSEPHLQPTPQLVATLDLNPLSEARD